MKAYINPANLITSGNLAAGFVALVLAARGELAWAAGLVGAAGVFDALDGLIARHTRCEGTFGSQLDSLADLASFGLAPALILYAGGLASLPVAGIGACLAFVLCGAWRLARFSLVESRYTFVGLPIPPAGLVAALLGAAPVPAPVVCATVVVGAVLMASTLPFPTFAGIAGALRRPRPREVHLPAPPERGEHAARPSR